MSLLPEIKFVIDFYAQVFYAANGNGILAVNVQNFKKNAIKMYSFILFTFKIKLCFSTC